LSGIATTPELDAAEARKVSSAFGLFSDGSDNFHLPLSAAAIVYKRKQWNVHQELVMDIVIAAEKSTIAKMLGEHIHRNIDPEDIRLTENPEETGSFYIGFHFSQYRMSPDGQIESDRLGRVD
jgi:hypothetical protein